MRILILGGSGMLGHKLLERLGARREWEVSCTLRAPRSSPLARLPLFAGDQVEWGIDARHWPQLEAVIRRRRPDVIVNALGIIKQRQASSDPVPSIQINSLLPHQLAALQAELGGRLIHFGTDCVFSGRTGHYLETDISDATDLYGRSKRLGDVAEATNAVTLRTSMIGRELTHHESLLDWFLAHAGRHVNGYRRAIYSGLTTIELSNITAMLITQFRELHGLYHVSGPAISKLDLLRLIAEGYGMHVTITPVDEPHCDRSLVGDRFAEATGYHSPPWPRLIADLAQDATPYADWLERLK